MWYNTNMNNTNSRELAKKLLEIKAVKLNAENPFTWTSGTISPIYCDNRMVLSYPEIRTFVKNTLAEIIKDKFPNTEVVAGVATAGIPHAVLVADILELPNCYVRPEPKKHGMKNQIEGNLPAGSKVVLVEDLIATGKSSFQSIQAVREAGSEVIGLVALFTYGFPDAKEAFEKENIPTYTISNFETLCEVAVEEKLLDEEKLQEVKNFAQNRDGWRK